MATALEAVPFIKRPSTTIMGKKPFRLYSDGTHTIILSGIGKANAAMAALYLTLNHDISTIINLGAAGSTSETYEVGDVIQINEIFEPDRPTLIRKKSRRARPDILKGFKSASLCTSDRPVLRPQERKEIAPLAELVDMEGAAVLQASRLLGKKCYLYKIVSDTGRHTRDLDIIINIKRIRNKLYDFFMNNISRKIQQ